jgi:hypothetical protein
MFTKEKGMKHAKFMDDFPFPGIRVKHLNPLKRRVPVIRGFAPVMVSLWVSVMTSNLKVPLAV